MVANLVQPSFTAVIPTQTTHAKNALIHDKNFSDEKFSSSLIPFITQIKKTEKSVQKIHNYRNILTLFCEFITENNLNYSNYFDSIPNTWIDFLKENGQTSNAKIKQSQKIVKYFLNFISSGGILHQGNLPKFNSLKTSDHTFTAVAQSQFITLTQTLKSRAMAGDSKSIRDWALILILGECGLKASEVANLTWGDVSIQDSQLKTTLCQNTRGFLHVKSEKGERLVPYSSHVEQALELLREVRTNLKLNTSPDATLFFAFLNISRKTRTNALHRYGIKFIVYAICEDILGVAYNSESLRNHAILRWIDKGYNSFKIAELAGYTTMNSMLKFLHSPNFKIITKNKEKWV